MAGVQGSGKSTFSNFILHGDNVSCNEENTSWVCYSQDIINGGKPGKREKVFEECRSSLLKGLSVIVDRMHLNPSERQATIDDIFTDDIKKLNICVHVVFLNPPKKLVSQRVSARVNHPAKVEGEKGVKLALMSFNKLVEPTYKEPGFNLISCVSTDFAAKRLAMAYHFSLAARNPKTDKMIFNSFQELKSVAVYSSTYSKNDAALSLSIPSISLGTMGIGRRSCADVVQNMLIDGFTSIDTAPTYKNEDKIGEALQRIDDKSKGSGESDVFIIAKVPKRATNADQVKEEFLKTLKNLSRDQVGLLLLHWPSDVIVFKKLREVWECMESFVKDCSCQALGVCNFNVKALSQLLRFCTIRPILNQVERHPLLPQHDLLEFSARQNIYIQAHTPLGGGRREVINNSTVVKIAEEIGCSPVQLIIRWNLISSTLVVTKCTRKDHAKEILSATRKSSSDESKLILSPEHMQALDSLGDGTRFVAPPFMYGKAVYCWGENMPSMH